MGRLNVLRNSLKHRGVIPSSEDIAQAKGDVSAFFTDATPAVFNVNLSDVDMAMLITRATTKELLKDAQDRAASGNIPAAMAGLRIAFDELIRYYGEGREIGSPHAPFGLGPTLGGYSDSNRDIDNKSGRQLESVTRVVQSLQAAMRIVALGIDYAQYADFDIQAPEATRHPDGTIRFVVDKHHKLLNDEDYRLARLFVIQSALQAARVDNVLHLMHDRNSATPLTEVSDAPEDQTWDGTTDFS
ncbi:hypothetical protein [Streptomyces chryseus]